MLSSQSTIDLYTLKSNDLEAQITHNSEELRQMQKYVSVDVDEIDTKYSMEEHLVNSELNNLDDKTGDEYKELMQEIKDLKDERDREVERIERPVKNKEEEVQVENDTLQTQKEAIDADKESLKEALNQEIENTFNYFK